MDNLHPIATLQDLKKVLVIECREKMVPLDNKSGIICHPRHFGTDTTATIFVRETVKDKLNRIQSFLSNYGLNLCVTYGYRSKNVQKKCYEDMYLRQKDIYPHLSPEELAEKTHLLIAHPLVAGHPTGGAVDATFYSNGQEVDMGSALYDFEHPDKIITFASHLTEQQRASRMLLHDAFCKEDFAPFYGEWWHFSYGDREWAVFYGKEAAIYSSTIVS